MHDWLFSLEALGPLLRSYTPPEANGDSEKAEYAFDLLSLTIIPHKAGRLSFKSGENSLAVRIDRPGEDGFRAFSDYSFTMDPDGLNLREWKARMWMARAEAPDNPYPLTELTASGRRESGGDISIKQGRRRRSETVEGPITGKWTLLEWIRQQGGSDGIATLDFSCLDEYAIINTGHRLQPGPWMEAPGGFRMRPFLHTGTGQIPRVLWVDGQSRLIAYGSGTEAAILVEMNGKEGRYDSIRYDLRKEKLSTQLR